MKLCLGVGPLPIHPQHLEVMGDLSEWTLVDLHVKDSQITNWDATQLPLETESVDTIYASHLLEHIPHTDVPRVLKHWYTLLKPGGNLILNVPNILWALHRVEEYESGATLYGYYHDWAGEHGLLSVIYGSQSHEGEYHKSAFTPLSLKKQLIQTGFEKLSTKTYVDAHDMGILFTTAIK